MIRNPIAAGRFYPGMATALHAEIQRLVDRSAPKVKAIGLVSPHAGYPYSGLVAAETLSRIQFKDTFVILGPNHTGRGVPFSIMTQGVWHTPLGEVEIDSAIARQILEHSNYLEEDEAAHQYEHSIEVQLPFLQYFKHDVKIVPIVLAHANGETYKRIGESIARGIRSSRSEAIIMASSDMTHYESQERARRKDAKAIEAILSLDEDQLLDRIDSLHITMCGYAPTVALISAAKKLGATQAELVRYQTSGDMTGDYDSVVGYAGVIIR
ncbi:MAG: AmmeMemoRadiSam system protein B [Chloroflexi bacterium]|nr:AmmeMemoRadiSam system protein B [Chloroflexota bacterium]